VVWSPDGTHIASSSDDGTVQVWDAANGGQVYTYRGHSDGVWGVAWAPDGKRIVSGGGTADSGRADTTVQVWDAANGEHSYTYRGHSAAVQDVAWSPNGKRIASGSGDATVQVWVAG
jgi:WD40 repeat protein